MSLLALPPVILRSWPWRLPRQLVAQRRNPENRTFTAFCDSALRAAAIPPGSKGTMERCVADSHRLMGVAFHG